MLRCAPRTFLLLALVPGTSCFSAPVQLAARGSKLAALGLKKAADPRCTVADDQAGDAIDDPVGNELRRRLFVEREPELVPLGLREGYSAAAGALASMALHATPADPSTPWVLLSMAMALLCDFGPSARRDLTSSVAASLAAANDYIEAGPAITLGSRAERGILEVPQLCSGLLWLALTRLVATPPTRDEPPHRSGPNGRPALRP